VTFIEETRKKEKGGEGAHIGWGRAVEPTEKNKKLGGSLLCSRKGKGEGSNNSEEDVKRECSTRDARLSGWKKKDR